MYKIVKNLCACWNFSFFALYTHFMCWHIFFVLSSPSLLSFGAANVREIFADMWANLFDCPERCLRIQPRKQTRMQWCRPHLIFSVLSLDSVTLTRLESSQAHVVSGAVRFKHQACQKCKENEARENKKWTKHENRWEILEWSFRNKFKTLSRTGKSISLKSGITYWK